MKYCNVFSIVEKKNITICTSRIFFLKRKWNEKKNWLYMNFVFVNCSHQPFFYFIASIFFLFWSEYQTVFWFFFFISQNIIWKSAFEFYLFFQWWKLSRNKSFKVKQYFDFCLMNNKILCSFYYYLKKNQRKFFCIRWDEQLSKLKSSINSTARCFKSLSYISNR